MMEEVVKKPWITLHLKNVHCYCCIFKDKKVTYHVTRSQWKKWSTWSGKWKKTLSTGFQEEEKVSSGVEENEPVVEEGDYQKEDDTSDVHLYCCCYHFLKKWLKKG